MTTSPASQQRMLSLSEFLHSLVQALIVQGVTPCILRNYEGFPDKNVGNDVDFMIHPRELTQALRAVRSIEGIRIVGYNEQFHVAGVFLEGISPVPNVRAFQVDFIRSFTFKGMPYLTTDSVLQAAVPRQAGDLKFMVPSPVHEAIISLLTNLIVFGFIKEKYFPKIQRTFASGRSEVIASLRPAFGLKQATRLVDATIDGDRQGILTCIRPLRIGMSLRNLVRRPIRSIFEIARHYSIVLGARLLPRNLETICILSPENGRKAAATEALILLLKSSAPSVEKHNSGPTQRAGGGRRAKSPSADSQAQGSTEQVVSMIGIFLWVMREWRSQFTGRKNLQLRICEGRFYEILIAAEKSSYRGPMWFARLAINMCPSPDLWILLDSAPEVRQSIGDDGQAAEIHKQLEAYRTFVRARKSYAIVDASQAADGIVESAYAAIVDMLTQRTAKRLKTRF